MTFYHGTGAKKTWRTNETPKMHDLRCGLAKIRRLPARAHLETRFENSNEKMKPKGNSCNQYRSLPAKCGFPSLVLLWALLGTTQQKLFLCPSLKIRPPGMHHQTGSSVWGTPPDSEMSPYPITTTAF
jgi:hypothetical protein